MCPSDFEQFWTDTLAELASVPLNAEFVRDSMRSTGDIDVFDVRFDSYQGVRIAGWLARPVAEGGRLPALIHVPGYVSEPLLPKGSAREGYCAFSLAPRGKLRSNDAFNPGYPGLLTHNIVDRFTYGYRGFFCDAIRCVDVLLERDDVDPARIGVTGSSQGGALAIVISAMRHELACAVAGAPYLCGMIDAIQLTHSYPYQEINDYLRLYPEREPRVRDTLEYFDGINFAPRIRCPILLNIGMKDDVCPPETGYAVYKAMRCNKELHPYDECAHDAGSQWHGRIARAFLASHLKPGQPS